MCGTSIIEYLADGEAPRAQAMFEKVARGAKSVRGEFEHIAKDGRSVFVDVAAFPIRQAGRVVGLEGIARDVSEQHALRAELLRQSLHDPLTGLPNRALCVDRINQALSRARGQTSTVAVLLLDVDEFKVVNDSLGHAAGDALLVELASRLRAVSQARRDRGAYGRRRVRDRRGCHHARKMTLRPSAIASNRCFANRF